MLFHILAPTLEKDYNRWLHLDVKRYHCSDEQPRIIKAELKEDPTPAVTGNTCDADPKSGDALSHSSHSEVERRYPQKIHKPLDRLNL